MNLNNGPYAIQIPRWGGPDVLQPMLLPPLETLGDQEVCIQVQACGVNFADLLMRMGLYPEAPPRPFIPGYEIAGSILAVGRQVKQFREGDAVLAGTRFGGYTQRICLPEAQVRPIPMGLSMEEAAAIPVNFLTASYALEAIGRIQSGDRVLIHSAAGGVGLAALQIALQAGAHVTGVISKTAFQEKTQVLQALGIHEVFCSDDPRFLQQHYQFILEPRGGKYLKQSFQQLTPLGKVISLGVSQIVSGHQRSLKPLLSLLFQSFWIHPFKLMMENKSISGINLLPLLQSPQLQPSISEMLDRILKAFQEGRYRVHLGKTFSLFKAGLAQNHLQSRTNIGKIVLIASASKQM